MLKLTSAAVLALVVLTGCASNYNCKGLPKGVTCMSAREVYEATDYAESISQDATEVRKGQAAYVAGVSGATAPNEAVQQFHADGPVPIRTPEKLMRIWVGPWEDSEGSLHMPTVIYTEIEKRRWTIGEMLTNPQASLSPLDVRSRNQSKAKYGAPADLSTVDLKHPLKGETKP